MKVAIPGAAWTALILALTGALGGWLTEYISEPWVPIAILALSLFAKAAEIYLTDKAAAIAPAGVRSLNTTFVPAPAKKPAYIVRLLVG